MAQRHLFARRPFSPRSLACNPFSSRSIRMEHLEDRRLLSSVSGSEAISPSEFTEASSGVSSLEAKTTQGRLFSLHVDGNDGRIYEVAPDTGAAVNSFPAPDYIDVSGYQGLALGPESLFFLDGSGNGPHTLYELDVATGATIDTDSVGSSSDPPVSGLAYLDGVVYLGRPSNRSLLKWDPITDQATGTLSVDFAISGGLTGAADLGLLFDSNNSGEVISIAPEDGRVVDCFQTGSYSLSGGLAYVGGELLGGDYRKGKIYRIDPATGLVFDSFLAPGSGKLTGLAGDGATPTLSIDDASVDEAAGLASFTVTLSAACGLDVTFDYATANDTATAGADYTATSVIGASIPAGNTSMTINVPILQDTIDELSETYFVNLLKSTNATIADDQGLGTITDDDATSTLSINDVSVDEATGTASFTVTLGAVSGLDVTFDYTTADDTATAGADYRATSAIGASIPAGNTSATINVPILQDTIEELNETYFVNLSDPTNAAIADDQGLGTVTDDDTSTTTTYADIVGRVAASGKWYVAESDGSSFTTSQWGKWSTRAAWEHVLIGDFNGDGRDDLVGRVAATGKWYVAESDGNSFTTSLWGKWSTKAAWGDVLVGDFNGDGNDDLASRVAASGKWYVAESNGSSFVTSLWDKWSTSATWGDVLVGDFNGDGSDDIASRASSGYWYVGASTGSAFNTTNWGRWSTRTTWGDMHVGDFNGDGRDDIASRPTSGYWYVGASTGSAFNTTNWGRWSTRTTWSNLMVGDFNGDGSDDIVGRAASGYWYVGASTDSAFSTSNWGRWSTKTTWSDVLVGDFTGDGRDDFAGRASSGYWYVGASTGTAFSTSNWGRWSTRATWTNVRVGHFDGAAPAAPGGGASAAADLFWSEIGQDEDDGEDDLLEPETVDLLLMD